MSKISWKQSAAGAALSGDTCSALIDGFCLNQLGVSSKDAINAWFRRYYDNLYRLSGIKMMADYISYLDRKTRIRIFGDYDNDGVMATSIMIRLLSHLGFSDVSFAIPDRKVGYGANPDMVKAIDGDSSTVIIMVDNGIAAFDAIAEAKRRGFTVLVLDHHLPPVGASGDEILPEADIIVDQWIAKSEADFDGYCGAFLAYKLAREILQAPISDPMMQMFEIYAAYAVISDSMPLREENYVAVWRAVKNINKGIRPLGINALLEAAGVEKLDSDTIAFQQIPLINAAGRLGLADPAVELFITEDAKRAVDIARSLKETNDRRKLLVSDAYEQLKKTVDLDNPGRFIVEYLPGVHEGIVGLLASRVSEDAHVPCIILTDSEDPDVLKGSGRSVTGLHLKNLLDRAGDLIHKYGGHEMAAGLSVKKSKFKMFKARVLNIADTIDYSVVPADTQFYDIEIHQDDMISALNCQKQFEPFGTGNSRPVFKVTNYSLIPVYGELVKEIGAKGLRGTNGKVGMIGFGLSDRIHEITDKMTIYGQLSVNYFRGNENPQINIKDFSPEVTKSLGSRMSRLRSARN